MRTVLLNIFLFLACFTISAQGASVTVSGIEFSPKDVTIKVGERVFWDNVGGVHNINGSQTAYPDNPEGFSNGNAASAPWKFSYLFNVPGKYDYHCDPHLNVNMVGTITVLDDSSNDAIVINEIMYNPPEGGTDSLEFIEIYNPGAANVNLNGYSLTGVDYTFGDFDLAAGAFVVVAGNADAINRQFGVTALEWESGALSNGGETITLLDASSNQIDIVTYSNAGGWPVTANGSGASLELCDAAGDNNDPANWAASENATGLTINGTAVFASPGATNNCLPSGPITYPFYPIGTVTTNNASGETDSLGVSCELRGVVYGVNIRPGGLQFTLIDNNNDGIHVFSENVDFGYVVTEGDGVTVQGAIAQFRGLAQIVADTVWMVDSGNALLDPTVVSNLDESTESQLVTIENVSLVDPGQWTNSGSGFNVDVTNGANTFQVRIDADVDIYGTNAPTGNFNVTGLGGQFDETTPFLEGYQLLPRYLADIDGASSIIDPTLAKEIELFPNPVKDDLFVQLSTPFNSIVLSNALGQKLGEWTSVEENLLIDMRNSKAGVYIITFMKGNRIWTAKVIK